MNPQRQSPVLKTEEAVPRPLSAARGARAGRRDPQALRKKPWHVYPEALKSTGVVRATWISRF